MRLYLRAHRAAPLAAASTALMLAAWWLAGTVLPVPQLLQGRSAPVAVEMLLTVLYAPLVAYACGGVPLRFEHGARRRLLWPDLCLLGVGVAPVAVVALLAALTGDAEFAANIVRDALAFTGAALLLLSALGETAAVTAPIGYFFTMSLLGVRPDGSAQWWAVLRAPATAATLLGALILFVAGAAAFHRWARPARARDR